MEENSTQNKVKKEIGFEDFRKDVLEDFRLAVESRQASLTGRKEVLTGKAKFGIFGDGKEVRVQGVRGRRRLRLAGELFDLVVRE